MATGFKWLLCNFVGGDYAVHPSFKTYLVQRPEAWATGELTVSARSTADLVVSGLGFKPTLLMMVCFRPRTANLQADTSFGNRGGGMTFGVGGLSQWGEPWDAGTTYNPGETAQFGGSHYVCLNTNLNDPPPSGNWNDVQNVKFTGSTRIKQGWDTSGLKIWREDATLAVVHGGGHGAYGVNNEALTLQHTFNSDGFTLSVDRNLYDESDVIFWMALDGQYTTGIMDAGTTELTGFNGTPEGVMFLSVKQLLPLDYNDNGHWDHMQGFASRLDGQNCIWGGCLFASWGWTTERWTASSAILLCKGAQGSFFAGAQVEAVGTVTDWHDGGIDIQWPTFNNVANRIGWIMSGQPSEAGYLQADFTKAGIQQLQPTRINPQVILMSTTNYNFDYTTLDPLASPRTPDTFQSGGGGGFGWHRVLFTEATGDAWGVHTYGNGVDERGHYANSSTQRQRGCIMAGAGANSTPPAQHQQGINIIPNPVIVGTNYRYAERHAHVKRLHVNESDV
jgi:hypothetical protein